MSKDTRPNLGKKIRYFRKRAGYSQFQLENEIGASAGSISRIENGEVNPTKETLVLITKAISLTPNEIADLFGISSLYPTIEDIKQALSESEELFARAEFLGYMIDDWWILRKVSSALLNILEISEEQYQKALGKNLLEVFFDPKYGVRKTVDQSKLSTNYSLELARAREEMNSKHFGDYFLSVIKNIENTQDFKEIYDLSKKHQSDLISAGSRVSYLNINGQKIKIHHARERLKMNPRFEIIELFNPQPYE